MKQFIRDLLIKWITKLDEPATPPINVYKTRERYPRLSVEDFSGKTYVVSEFWPEIVKGDLKHTELSQSGGCTVLNDWGQRIIVFPKRFILENL